MNDLHGIILSYRSNPHLRELTQFRNNSSVPYGGRYRLIDFMLSSMVDAGMTDVGVIVHESYQSLLDHIGSGKDWDLSRKHGGLHMLPPFGYAEKGHGEYRGVMEALSGVSYYLRDIRQDYVMLAPGDLALNLPVAEIFQRHLDSGADITAVCTRSPSAESRECVYLTMGADGLLSDVAVHPSEPRGCESLEIYFMSKALLLNLVEHCAAHDIVSFSRGVLLNMVHTLKIAPYVFDGYVARFPSVAQYFSKSMELLDPKVRAQLFLPARPIRTRDQSNPSTYYGPGATSVNSLVADGCVIEGAVENSILFRGVRVGKNAKISNCILMQGTTVGEGTILAYTIADKNVQVQANRTLMGHAAYPLAVSKDSVV